MLRMPEELQESVRPPTPAAGARHVLPQSNSGQAARTLGGEGARHARIRPRARTTNVESQGGAPPEERRGQVFSIVFLNWQGCSRRPGQAVTARPLRIEMADGVWHVTSRGVGRRAIVAGAWRLGIGFRCVTQGRKDAKCHRRGRGTFSFSKPSRTTPFVQREGPMICASPLIERWKSRMSPFPSHV